MAGEMPNYVSIILLVILAFFAFNFAVLTFYLWWKLRKLRRQRIVNPDTETGASTHGQVFESESSFASRSLPTQKSLASSQNDSNASKHTEEEYNRLLSRLDIAMTQGNQTQLEQSIKQLKQHTSNIRSLQCALAKLGEAETLLENLQLRQNIETALKIEDVWSIERAVRAIAASQQAAKNSDLLELAERGKMVLRTRVSIQNAFYNLMNSDNLRASIHMAEIVGLEHSTLEARQLLNDKRRRLEVSECKADLLKAISGKQVKDLESAIFRANQLQYKDSELLKEYSRAKMLLDWLIQLEQAKLRLKTAIISRDQTLLAIAIKKFKDYNLPDDDGDLKTAKRLHSIFECRVQLALAMESRDTQVVSAAIEQAERLGCHHAPELKHVMRQTMLLQKQLILSEEIVALIDTNWCNIMRYNGWKRHEIQSMSILGNFLGVSGESDPRQRKSSTESHTLYHQFRVIELGKERLKRRLQGFDTLAISWQLCESIKPELQQLKLVYIQKNKKKALACKIAGKLVAGVSNSQQQDLDAFFYAVYEWCQSIVSFVEERLKSRQIYMLSKSQ